MNLTRDQILTCDDTPLIEVPVKQWGGSVWIRSIRAGETERVTSILSGGADQHTQLVTLLSCDSDGNPLFTQEDIEALKKKSLSAIQSILKAIIEAHPVLSADTKSIEGN